jgi:hypothetical protein
MEFSFSFSTPFDNRNIFVAGDTDEISHGMREKGLPGMFLTDAR